MTFTPTEPTPCLLDNRWITLDPIGNQQAANICRTCPALDACKLDRADKIRNDPDFAWFEGVMAGYVHNPRAERRARENASRAARAEAAGYTNGQPPALAAQAARLRGLTHCKRGHEFTDDNTYVDPGGNRTCRTCIRATKAEWRRNKGVPEKKGPATHCQRGHEYSTENTHVDSDGKRRCRTCRRITKAAWLAKKEQADAA